ncbi:helix-turn-helix transcriptional regulator [Sinanaerobacter sp. ZZT-01]|uniref:helix-turn-helix transcriptional regulator n=1 Tax=Sinanaerobacter sp. ZZT-01 TaxID=3111540 RepID=UPI002D7980C9|nr:helix-turn-helix transcriptional regulator [Sinanaerobacter sp. ZZT-01]WRR94217.1 helix-turn-helix transcriptional regulator [Sinanaerobacter sp. ZZT-01]
MNRLKQERKRLGLTQNDLAKKIGVSPQAICEWEKGRKFPRRPALDRLENLFGLNYRELFAAASNDDPFSSTN